MSDELELHKNVEKYINSSLDKLMFDGKQEYLVYDTLLGKIAQFHQISDKNAHTLVQKIIRDCKDYSEEKKFVFDGTTIRPRNSIKRCSCGARFSTILRECPSCNNR